MPLAWLLWTLTLQTAGVALAPISAANYWAAALTRSPDLAGVDEVEQKRQERMQNLV